MKKQQPRTVGVNSIGTVGYAAAMIAWVLLIAVTLEPAMQTAMPSLATPESSGGTSFTLGGATTWLAYVVAGLMALVALAVLLLLPFLIAKFGSLGLRKALHALRVAPTKRHMFFAKSIVTTLPLIGFFIVSIIQSGSMTFAVIYLVAVIAAVLALVAFFLQIIIARALRVPERSIW